MGISYPDKTNTKGIWKLSDITRNVNTEGTYPGSSGHTALCGGGYTSDFSNVIDEFNMLTSGNAVDFGDLVTARSGCGSNSNHTRMIWSGGETGSNFATQDYVHFTTKGNAADFGDLSTAQGNTTRGTGNNIKAVTSSGSGDNDLLNTFTFATLGTSTSFGNLTAARNGAPQGIGDGVRGTYAGGMAPNQSNIIDFIQITTNSNATDFGDLSVARGEATSADSKTRAVCFSGRTNTPSPGSIANTIDTWQISSQGNAVDFGDMHVARKGMGGGLSNTIKGFAAGGTDSSANTNSIEQNTLASAGNGSDFGDLSVTRSACPGNTSSHGGLAAGELFAFIPRAPELYSPTVFPLASGLGTGQLGVNAGGDGDINVISFVTINTIGNAQDFGDLSAAQSYAMGAGSSSTRGIFGSTANDSDYITFSTKGNSAFFGNLSANRAHGDALSNDTRMIFCGGNSNKNVLDYVTIATIGNAADFGDLNYESRLIGSTANNTRGIVTGGLSEPDTMLNHISYVTIGSTGNASDFGDLTFARNRSFGSGSSTRGVFMGGYGGSPLAGQNVIDYITIGSTGNAIDFGDLTVARYGGQNTSNNIRQINMGGSDPATNTIDYVTIASTGNATDFGNMLNSVGHGAACSNGHGGLS